jgi:hypothetical protein
MLPVMFVETITADRDEWTRWSLSLRVATDPPTALVASIAWDSGNGTVTAVNVWDSPEAVADFFVERVHPTLSELGEPASRPVRHGQPLAFYARGLTIRDA